MTECQGCGAWNDTRRIHCVLCGTPLAETDEWDAAAELPPLPPLPDGGLSDSMPAWLRQAPAVEAAPAVPPMVAAGVSGAHQVRDLLEPLGPRADPRTFLTDDDFPQWLRDLAARDAASRPTSPPGLAAAPLASLDVWPAWPGAADAPPAPSPLVSSADEPTPAVPATEPAAALAPVPEGRPGAAAEAARPREERRPREPWETLLLVLLFIVVVVAALWALAANGVFSPAL